MTSLRPGRWAGRPPSCPRDQLTRGFCDPRTGNPLRLPPMPCGHRVVKSECKLRRRGERKSGNFCLLTFHPTIPSQEKRVAGVPDQLQVWVLWDLSTHRE